MRFTISQIVDAIRQGQFATPSGVSLFVTSGFSPYTVQNIAENLPMPPLVLHRDIQNRTLTYTILAGEAVIAAIWREAQLIKAGTPTVNIDQFWRYDVDIDFLDVDIETAKQTADRIREARW
jgi:hypothetical protein